VLQFVVELPIWIIRNLREREAARGGGLGSSTIREVGGWGRVPFSRNLMSPTPRRKWYLTSCLSGLSEIYVNERQLKVAWRGGGLGSSTIFKDLMSPTPRRKWYSTTGRRAH